MLKYFWPIANILKNLGMQSSVFNLFLKFSYFTLSWVITATMFSASVKLLYSDNSLSCSQRGATIYYIITINEKQINITIIKWRYISAPRSWSHKEYSCFDFPVHSVFTFVEFWGGLGTTIFRNSSSAGNNTRCRLSFHSLWLWFCIWCFFVIDWFLNILYSFRRLICPNIRLLLTTRTY